jgi:hypothetical protein
MRRALAIAALLLLSATPAYADSASWTADPPKDGSGDVVWCTASASAGGDTYTMRNWAPIDPVREFDHERYARRVFTEDVKRAMLFRFEGRPHVVADHDVTVTCGGGR